MLIAASKGAETIDAPHLEEAREILLEMEAVMPLALEHMGTNPLAVAVKSLHKWMLIEYLTKRRPLGESAIRRFLMNDIPVQYHDATIENLLVSGLLKTQTGIAPARTFIPLKRQEDLDAALVV
jgi:hypothetical protein